METIKLSQLKPNAKNPRQIKGERLELLKSSIASFQKMMELRPMIVDEDCRILGGNMRYAAICALGLKEIPASWVKQVSDLTEEEKREFIIKDNSGFGEWDWEILANEWDANDLAEWGIEIQGFGGQNKELDPSGFTDVITLKLEYPSSEYGQVMAALRKIAATPEQALWKLLDL